MKLRGKIEPSRTNRCTFLLKNPYCCKMSLAAVHMPLCIKILREDIAISRDVKSPGTWFFMLGDNDVL
jgi:hypothetical protein